MPYNPNPNQSGYGQQPPGATSPGQNLSTSFLNSASGNNVPDPGAEAWRVQSRYGNGRSENSRRGVMTGQPMGPFGQDLNGGGNRFAQNMATGMMGQMMGGQGQGQGKGPPGGQQGKGKGPQQGQGQQMGQGGPMGMLGGVGRMVSGLPGGGLVSGLLGGGGGGGGKK